MLVFFNFSFFFLSAIFLLLLLLFLLLVLASSHFFFFFEIFQIHFFGGHNIIRNIFHFIGFPWTQFSSIFTFYWEIRDLNLFVIENSYNFETFSIAKGKKKSKTGFFEKFSLFCFFSSLSLANIDFWEGCITGWSKCFSIHIEVASVKE